MKGLDNVKVCYTNHEEELDILHKTSFEIYKICYLYVDRLIRAIIIVICKSYA